MKKIQRRKTLIASESFSLQESVIQKGSQIVMEFTDSLADLSAEDLTVYEHFAVAVQSLQSGKLYAIMFKFLEDCDQCYSYLAEIERGEASAENESVYWDWINQNSALVLRISSSDLVTVSDHGELSNQNYGRVYVRNMVPVDSKNLEL